MKKRSIYLIGIICFSAVTVTYSQETDEVKDEAEHRKYLENYTPKADQSSEVEIKEDVEAYEKAVKSRKDARQNYKPDIELSIEMLEEEEQIPATPSDNKAEPDIQSSPEDESIDKQTEKVIQPASSVLGESKNQPEAKEDGKLNDKLYVPANADFIIEDPQSGTKKSRKQN